MINSGFCFEFEGTPIHDELKKTKIALADLLAVLDQMDASDASTGHITSTDRIKMDAARALLSTMG